MVVISHQVLPVVAIFRQNHERIFVKFKQMEVFGYNGTTLVNWKYTNGQQLQSNATICGHFKILVTELAVGITVWWTLNAQMERIN